MTDTQTHDWTEHYWCRNCGMGMDDATELNAKSCPATGNVTGISHIVRPRKLAVLVEALFP